MAAPSVATRVSRAVTAIGKGSSFAGMCEKFTRGHFGFPAKYASAKRAYEASKRDGKITIAYNAPAGTVVFWDILGGKNVRLDHVAISVGGGWCISTSAGPGGTVAKVKIEDLTRRWGMKYLGWADTYHGQRIYTAPSKAPQPKPTEVEPGTTRYPDGPSGVTEPNLNTSWYRLLGALDYFGSTVVRLQQFLKASNHYGGPRDGVLDQGVVIALQRRLKDAGYYGGDIDGDRGPMTRQAESDYLNAHAWRAR